MTNTQKNNIIVVGVVHAIAFVQRTLSIFLLTNLKIHMKIFHFR